MSLGPYVIDFVSGDNENLASARKFKILNLISISNNLFMKKASAFLPFIAVFGLNVVVKGNLVNEPLLSAMLTLIQNRSGRARLAMKLKSKRDVINEQNVPSF
jgi:hypothetical protein